MSETAERPTRRCSEHYASATNRFLSVGKKAGIVCENLPNTKDALMLVVAMIVIAMALRPGIASIGPILPLISRAFSLSHAAASLLTTIPILLMGVLAIPSAWMAKVFGRARVLLASLLVLLVSMVARTFAANVAVLFLSTVGVGSGIAVAGTLFAGLIKSRFPAKVALMMSLYATALAFSSTVSAAATGTIAALSGSNGWRLGTGIWTPVALIAVGAALVVLIREKPEVKRAKATRHAPLPLASRSAWLIALFFACDNFLFFAFLAWLAPIYIERGFSAVSASLLLAIFTISFTLAIPVLGSLSRTHDRRGWLAACAGLIGVGTLALAVTPLVMPHVWVAIAAFGLGGGFTLGMTLPLDNVHAPDEVESWNAFVMTIGYLVAAAGPFVVGALRDFTGSFSIPIWLGFIIAVATLVLTPFLAPCK